MARGISWGIVLGLIANWAGEKIMNGGGQALVSPEDNDTMRRFSTLR